MQSSSEHSSSLNTPHYSANARLPVTYKLICIGGLKMCHLCPTQWVHFIHYREHIAIIDTIKLSSPCSFLQSSVVADKSTWLIVSETTNLNVMLLSSDCASAALSRYSASIVIWDRVVWIDGSSFIVLSRAVYLEIKDDNIKHQFMSICCGF